MALLFGSEILLWNDPPSRTALDWSLLTLGYLALSAVLLDLGVRWRVRDVFGLMMLAGLYGLLNGALLNPQAALLDVPRTLVTRVLGAHTLAGLLMLALFLTLHLVSRKQAIATGLTGLVWGVWVRWLPTLADTISADVPLAVMLIYGALPLLILIVLLTRRSRADSSALRLSTIEWLFVFAALLLLFVRHVTVLDLFTVTVVTTLSAFCVLLLWFQKREKSATAFDGLEPVPLFPMLRLSVLFLAAGAAGYLLPLREAFEPLTLYVALFTAFGVVWLPSVSLVLGVRAYRRLTRQRRL